MTIAGIRISTAAIVILAISARQSAAVLVTIPFNSPGSVAAQTAPFGISTFVANSFTTTQGISSLFTGNASAPISPPSALSLGAAPGPGTYFHFSPLPGYQIDSISISATGAFTGQSTTFRVFAANSNLDSIQYDAVMTPTGAGVAGLNGGALFLSANALPAGIPITAFRVWQLDDGFGILDNLVANVSTVPEAHGWLMLGVVGTPLAITSMAAARTRRPPGR